MLDHAALGPSLQLAIASPIIAGGSSASLTVLGYDTNYGEVGVGILSAGVPASGSARLDISIGEFSQLNQNGTIMTIDFLSGTLNTPLSIGATIKDWNSHGTIDIGADPNGATVNALQFNRTSAAGGDLLLLSKGTEVGSFHLLGAYATTDFKLGCLARERSASPSFPHS